MRAFFVRTLFLQLFPRTRNVHVTRKKADKMTFVRKICDENVDEIDTWYQHQLINRIKDNLLLFKNVLICLISYSTTYAK